MSRRWFCVPDQPPGLRRWVPILAGVALCLGACTHADIDKIPTSVGGLPAAAPARPATPPAFPAVHDMPPPRSQALLDEEEQKRLEKDLTALRNRQAPDSAKKQPKAQNTGQKPNP